MIASHWISSKLRNDERLVPLVQSMYMYWDVRSKVRVGIGYTEEFGVELVVHQGSANRRNISIGISLDLSHGRGARSRSVSECRLAS